MKRIDLITGFLGSGKTTFLRAYTKYLLNRNTSVGIVENDFGAINVDRLLLQDLESDRCSVEMVAGGCDADCHRRRFRTKLIALYMQPYEHILVEPSGIYDTDEFFDVLRDEQLENWYQAGSVIFVADATMSRNLSKESTYLLALQLSSAGIILINKTEGMTPDNIRECISYYNSLLAAYQLPARANDDFLTVSPNALTDADFEKILHAGYRKSTIPKLWMDQQAIYDACYIMDKQITKEKLDKVSPLLFQTGSYGTIHRIKGFFRSHDQSWAEYNETPGQCSIQPINEGQDVVIVIGENLQKEKIEKLFEA